MIKEEIKDRNSKSREGLLKIILTSCYSLLYFFSYQLPGILERLTELSKFLAHISGKLKKK